jgi:ATP-dependent phosphofructokinase / diphosphate-dependent phosphofructokinase
MGRKIGFIPAAARLADPYRQMPLQIYLAESPCSLAELHANVNAQLRVDGRCVVVVSEGFDVGDFGQVKDSFGHTQFGSSESSVAQIVTNYLNQQGLCVKGKARLNIPGTDQRHSMAYASTVDLDEAYRAGQQAVLMVAAGTNGMMATILRDSGPLYRVRYGGVPLEKVALSERTFPHAWIAASGYDVTDDFLRYARPLIGEEMLTLPMIDGRPRMAQLEKRYAQPVLSAYIPQADR